MSHLPGEAKLLCVEITLALMRGRAGELLQIQRSATASSSPSLSTSVDA